MIKNVIERNYYNDENGEMSLLYKFLSCGEKMEYILLNERGYIPRRLRRKKLFE